MSYKHTDWEDPSLLERLRSKETNSSIAADLGITRERVRQVRLTMGIRSTYGRDPFVINDELLAKLGQLPDTVIASIYDVHPDVVRRERRARGIHRYVAPIRHGTRVGYIRGCRCTACRRSQADGMSAWIKKNPDRWKALRERQRVKALASAPHEPGKIGWYMLGCRCAGCKKAQRDYYWIRRLEKEAA